MQLNVGIARIEIYVDSKLQATLVGVPYTTSWNASGKNVAKGEHIITAYAYDAAGNMSTASIRVVK
jgi:hypothetical protein